MGLLGLLLFAGSGIQIINAQEATEDSAGVNVADEVATTNQTETMIVPSAGQENLTETCSMQLQQIFMER